jgi:hypothetical protein
MERNSMNARTALGIFLLVMTIRPAPASARFYTNWKCGELSLQLQEYKGLTVPRRDNVVIDIDGLKPGTALSFKWREGTPYVNGKRCRIEEDK